MSKKYRVYIAARFSRRPEAHEIAKWLQHQGHTITSRWVLPNDDHVLPTGLSAQAEDAERQRFALGDWEDVRVAGWCISLTEPPRNNSRGGRHVEFGMAIALGHRLTVIGPRETVFHHLPNIEHYENMHDFLVDNHE